MMWRMYSMACRMMRNVNINVKVEKLPVAKYRTRKHQIAQKKKSCDGKV